MALLTAPLHSLHLDDRIEVQNDIFGHAMPLVLVSLLLDTTVNCIPLVKITDIRCKMTLLVMSCHLHRCLHLMMLLAVPVSSLHSLGQDNENYMQHGFFVT